MVAAEERYSRCAAVGVYVSDSGYTSASTDAVRAAIEEQLLIPGSDTEVSLFPPAGFLVLFSDSCFRDHAMDCHNGIDLGGPRLFFRPWTRMVNASAASLMFKMRVCIEGVPPHARQPETLRSLFHPDTLIECIDAPLSDQEMACCCVKLWTSNPHGFALEGALRLEESLQHGQRRRSWDGPANLLGFEVMLHLDYSPPTTPDAAWPKRANFDWSLGIRDDHCAPTLLRSVRDRLGPSGRDRSPTLGTGDGGRDTRRRRSSTRNGTGPTRQDGASSSRDCVGFVNTPYHYGHATTELLPGAWVQTVPAPSAWVQTMPATAFGAPATRARQPSPLLADAGLQPFMVPVCPSPARATHGDLHVLCNASPTASPMMGDLHLPAPTNGVAASAQVERALLPAQPHGAVGDPWAAPPAYHDDNPFGPLCVEEAEQVLNAHGDPPAGGEADIASPPLLDTDAEDTTLPPGLLDSPPSDHPDADADGDAERAPSPAQRFLDTMTAPPPAPALPHPPVTPATLATPVPANAEAVAPTPQCRFSERQRQRLADTPCTKTATERAVEVQFKWMGLNDDRVNPNAEKKKHCLSKYTGNDKLKAQAALDDLFADKAGTISN